MDAACGLCGGEQDCSFVYNKVKHFNGMIDTTDRKRKTAIKGPLCTLRAHDLGYAVGSASIASNLFVDANLGIPSDWPEETWNFARNPRLW